MENISINRRLFLKKAGVASILTGISGKLLPASFTLDGASNPLPRWRGFNLLDYFGPTPPKDNSSSATTEDDFKWMADWGFDFVRLPMAYPRYIKFDRAKNVTPDDVLNIDEKIVDEVVQMIGLANKYKLHMSLNLHRAPGYCVNAGFNEPYNLWKDEAAQQAFKFHWEMWSKRLKDFSRDQVSFDLVNEPSMRENMNDQFGRRDTVPGAIYRKVAKETAEVIRKYNPSRIVVADGNDVGSSVIPEITDLDIAQSCRGYFPHYISHYRAPWVYKNPDTAPMPVWPGTTDNKYFGRESLNNFYAPWIELVKKGVGVHCGECGCWRETPHAVFLAWFGDVLDILTQHEIGYALWNFRGDFGVLDSDRKDIEYEDWHGHKLDRKMLTMLQKY
jgi:endoglucanase